MWSPVVLASSVRGISLWWGGGGTSMYGDTHSTEMGCGGRSQLQLESTMPSRNFQQPKSKASGS
jgi:hypothetical protein